MAEKPAEKQPSSDSVGDKKKTADAAKQEYINAMVRLMDSSVKEEDRKEIATTVYGTIEEHLKSIPGEIGRDYLESISGTRRNHLKSIRENPNPADSLSELCESYGCDKLDVIELIMEVEVELDISLFRDSYLDGSGECKLSVVGLANAFLEEWKYIEEARARKAPEPRYYGPIKGGR